MQKFFTERIFSAKKPSAYISACYAYGNCHILEPNFAPDPDGKSDYGNPYLFAGRRVDILNSGSLKIQYNRNRYYDYYTGRWLTQDTMGIAPNAQKPNSFDVFGQYKDGLNLYQYVQSNAVMNTDLFGLPSIFDWVVPRDIPFFIAFVTHRYFGLGELWTSGAWNLKRQEGKKVPAADELAGRERPDTICEEYQPLLFYR